MQPKTKKDPKIITFGPELKEDFFLAPPPPQSQQQGRQPTPPASPQSQRQHLYWHETVLCWNQNKTFKVTLTEYIPCLLGIIWQEPLLGPIEQLTSFPPQAQYYFVKSHEQSSFSSSASSSGSFHSIFYSSESSYQSRHLRRFSEPDLPGPRYFDPNGITQSSWLFSKFLEKVLKLTTVSCTCLILSLKFAQLYFRKKRASSNSTAQQLEDNQFRIFVVSIMLANKYTEDHPYISKAWSTLSGMPIYEINEMECDFLSLLGHELYISASEFRDWTVTLQSLCQWRLPSQAYIEHCQDERRLKQLQIDSAPTEKHHSFWSRFKSWRK